VQKQKLHWEKSYFLAKKKGNSAPKKKGFGSFSIGKGALP